MLMAKDFRTQSNKGGSMISIMGCMGFQTVLKRDNISECCINFVKGSHLIIKFLLSYICS